VVRVVKLILFGVLNGYCLSTVRTGYSFVVLSWKSNVTKLPDLHMAYFFHSTFIRSTNFKKESEECQVTICSIYLWIIFLDCLHDSCTAYRVEYYLKRENIVAFVVK